MRLKVLASRSFFGKATFVLDNELQLEAQPGRQLLDKAGKIKMHSSTNQHRRKTLMQSFRIVGGTVYTPVDGALQPAYYICYIATRVTRNSIRLLRARSRPE